MEKSEAINELATALSQVQGLLPPVVKSQTATVKGTSKTGNPYEYTYAYASLDAVWDSCRKPLSESGLAITQVMSEKEGHPQIETVLMHTSGQWITSLLPLMATADPQQLGSQITYYRRYALSALLGIVTDEDKDGQTAPSANRPAARQQPPLPPTEQSPPGQQAAQPSSAPPTDTPEELDDYAAECRPMFDQLDEEIQRYLLRKYGSSQSLEAVPAVLRDRLKSELVDRTNDTPF